MSTNIQHMILPFIQRLCANYHEAEATSIVWELVTHVTHKSKIALLTTPSALTPDYIAQLEKLIDTHLTQHIPIAYLTNRVQFGTLSLVIRPPILIPRSETEEWCYRLISMLQPIKHEPLNILDLCTGSGCITLALAQALPAATVTGVDIDPEALALAAENSKQLGITNCRWIKSDLFENLTDQTFDLIVANPPYVSNTEQHTLAPSVREFESHLALFAPDDGYDIIERIITQAPRFIKHGVINTTQTIPQLCIEIGHTQSERVKTFLQTHKYVNIETWKDYQGHNRVVCAQAPVCLNVSLSPKT